MSYILDALKKTEQAENVLEGMERVQTVQYLHDGGQCDHSEVQAELKLEYHEAVLGCSP